MPLVGILTFLWCMPETTRRIVDFPHPEGTRTHIVSSGSAVNEMFLRTSLLSPPGERKLWQIPSTVNSGSPPDADCPGTSFDITLRLPVEELGADEPEQKVCDVTDDEDQQNSRINLWSVLE